MTKRQQSPSDKPLATMHHFVEQKQTTKPPTMTIKQPTGGAVPLPTRMVLSAFAGMGAAVFCHPLDVVRVQMQTFHYRNTAHAAVSIYKNAGFANGLYAGISAAFLRQWLYGSCRMGLYSYLLERARNKKGGADNISFASKLLFGSISGGIGSFVGTPSEVALVRMSADSRLPLAERRNYTSVFNCLSRISQEEGVTKLWRGVAPTVARATLLSSTQLAVTSQAKLCLSDSGYFGPNGQWIGGLPMMFCATLCSSFCANIVANPFDVVKSRMQQMPIAADGTALYTSMGDCFAKSIRAEGLMVLYAGFTPAFVKLAPYSIISLTLADKLTKAMTGKDAL
jgi:solute carrier family 25 oxoglutarate transporter 11